MFNKKVQDMLFVLPSRRPERGFLTQVPVECIGSIRSYASAALLYGKNVMFNSCPVFKPIDASSMNAHA